MRNLVIEKLERSCLQSSFRKQDLLKLKLFGRKASFETLAWSNLNHIDKMLTIGKEVNTAFHSEGSGMKYFLENENELADCGIVNITENKRKNRTIAIAVIKVINENTIEITDVMILGSILRACIVESIETYVEFLKYQYNCSVVFNHPANTKITRNGFIGIQKVLSDMSGTKSIS